MSLVNPPPKPGGFIPRDRTWQPDGLTPTYKTSVRRSPQAPLLSFPSTLSEETSPVFGHHLIGPLDNDLILNYAQPGQSAIGPRIIVHGRVLDELGRGVAGALVESWQANAGGRYRHKKIPTLAAAGGQSPARTDHMNSARSSPAPILGPMG
jgi:protocatechuate 3,4-dioxygenase, beta subunit